MLDSPPRNLNTRALVIAGLPAPQPPVNLSPRAPVVRTIIKGKGEAFHDDPPTVRVLARLRPL
jgi:hypothetical protein